VDDVVLGIIGAAFTVGLAAGFGLASIPIRRRSPSMPHIPPPSPLSEPIDPEAVAERLQQIRDGTLDAMRLIAANSSESEADRQMKRERRDFSDWYLANRRTRQTNPSAWGGRLPEAASLWRDDRLVWLGASLGFGNGRQFADEVKRTRAEHARKLPYKTFSGVITN
jgi:hypothetical protein